MRAKIRAWARFYRILRILRENATEIKLLKSKTSNGKLPHWTLLGGRYSLNNNQVNYYVKKHFDQKV